MILCSKSSISSSVYGNGIDDKSETSTASKDPRILPSLRPLTPGITGSNPSLPRCNAVTRAWNASSPSPCTI